jgi:hypothetical protein
MKSVADLATNSKLGMIVPLVLRALVPEIG